MTEEQRRTVQATAGIGIIFVIGCAIFLWSLSLLWTIALIGIAFSWLIIITTTLPNGTRLLAPLYPAKAHDGQITVRPLHRNLYLVPLGLTFALLAAILFIDAQAGSGRALGLLIWGSLLGLTALVIGIYATPTIHFLALRPDYFEVKATRLGKELYHARSTNPEYILPDDMKLRINGLIAHNIEIISGAPPSTGAYKKPFAWDPTMEVHIPPLRNAHRDELIEQLLGAPNEY